MFRLGPELRRAFVKIHVHIGFCCVLCLISGLSLCSCPPSGDKLFLLITWVLLVCWWELQSFSSALVLAGSVSLSHGGAALSVILRLYSIAAKLFFVLYQILCRRVSGLSPVTGDLSLSPGQFLTLPPAQCICTCALRLPEFAALTPATSRSCSIEKQGGDRALCLFL